MPRRPDPARPDRRRVIGQWSTLLLGSGLAACGGGGGGGDASPSSGPAATEGSRIGTTLSSRATGTAYPLSLYVPPDGAGPRQRWPVLVLLDGDTWFETAVVQAQGRSSPLLIVGVHSAGMRGRDFVPTNGCTSGGGGQAAYFDFLRQELLPFVESRYGGDPTRRVLFGHSHGGSFVLWALFQERPGQHSFGAYLASDSSIACMPDQVAAWEQAYVAQHASLPVRLHLSYATGGNYTANLNYAAALRQRGLSGLTLVHQAYSGTHLGIGPQVLAEAVPFALAGLG